MNAIPRVHIFFLSFIPINKLIKKSKTHIAQGLNPSKNPSTIVKAGRDNDSIFKFPIFGRIILGFSSEGSHISSLELSESTASTGISISSSGFSIGFTISVSAPKSSPAKTSKQPFFLSSSINLLISLPVVSSFINPTRYLSPIIKRGTPLVSIFNFSVASTNLDLPSTSL